MDDKIYEDLNEGVLRQVGCGQKILDVGCGTGTLGFEIKKRGNEVWGLDINKKAIDLAKKKLDKTFLYDSADPDDLPIKDEKFDVIVFADILEHLDEPEAVLREYKKYLKEDGCVIVSLPNFASWTIRFKRLFGPLKPAKYGILDETHKHFYDLEKAKKLVEEAGIEIKKLDVNPNIMRAFMPLLRRLISQKPGSKESGELDKAIIESRFYRIYRKLVLPLELVPTRIFKNCLAFQFIIIGSP